MTYTAKAAVCCQIHTKHSTKSEHHVEFCMLNLLVDYMVRPCSKNGRRKITQNSIEVDAETKVSTRKAEEKVDGRYKEGHERKKPK